MSDKLPSIDNLPESELPSVDEFIKEEEKLPSVQDFVENPDESDEIEAEKEEDEAPGTPCSVEESQDLTEIVRLINDVRKDIPDIPEIKYYDEELEKLTEQVELVRDSIPEVPEIKYYDDEIASLREEINQNAADIPEIKYYDEQVNDLEEKIKVIKEDIVNLPEPKYYEVDLESLKEDILAVKESIPVFPKWVNEVNQVPDFSWIGKTFGVIDDDFSKVNDHINDLKDRFDDDINHLTEDLDKKDFEKRVSIDKITSDLKETKDKIYKELREAALRINDTKHSFKNDDRLLKKDILGKLNVLKQRVEEEVKEFNRKNTEAKDIFDGYFTALTEEIENLPKVKYYDEDIKKVREDFNISIDSLKILVEEIKSKQETLKEEQDVLTEEVNNRPIQPDPGEDNKDPLTPTNKKFATLEDLSKHYQLFVNRVQQQLYTIGGGGAGFIKDLDDVSFDESSGTNKLLIYNGDGWVGIASTALSGSSTLDEVLTKGNVSGIGLSVGVITATSGYFSGILTAAQLNYDVVTDIYSTGIVTATKGIQQTGNEGLHVTAGVSTFVGLTSCLGGLHVRAGSAVTSLIVEGDGRVTGILTIGTGSITLDAANNKVSVGTGITLDASTSTILVGGSKVADSSGQANYTGIVTAAGGVEVGSAATIKSNGNATFSGIVTATKFVGSGEGLTGVASTDNIQTTTEANLIGGLKVGTAATIKANGNATFSGIVTASSFVGDGTGLTGVASTDNIQTGTPATFLSNVNITGVTTATGGVHVGTAATIYSNGNITCGIITATSFTVAGTSLAETIADTVGGMVSSNTESGITVAYQDADNTLDFTVGTLNQDTTGNAATATALETARNIGGVSFDGSANINLPGVNTAGDQDTSGNATTATTATTATNITVSANNSTDETVYPIFVDGATGGQGAETDTGLTYNPSDGNLTSTTFTGALTGNVTGNASGSSGSCTGNAATATILATARNIGGVSFDGSAAIDLPGVNASGSQNTSGTAAGLSGTPNITVGDVVAASLDISGDADIDGTLEADAITVNGTALDTHIAGVTVTTATNATNFACSANNSTDETVYPVFVDGATGNQGAETDTGLSYNPNSGTLTAAVFSGSGASLTNIPGIASESDTAVSSTSATTVATISASTYRAAIVDVVITQGSAYQAGQYGLIHDGTTATIVEQWAIATGSMLGTFTATISGGNMLMQVNMGSSSSATVTVKSNTITV